MFSERLLDASNFDDLQIFVDSTGSCLQIFEKELALQATKNVMVEFAEAMGYLVGTLICRLMSRHEVLKHFKVESKIEDDSNMTGQLRYFTSKLTLRGEGEDQWPRSIHQGDFREYHNVVRQQSTELEAQIAVSNIDAVRPFHHNMTNETDKLFQFVVSMRQWAGSPVEAKEGIVVPRLNEFYKIPRTVLGLHDPARLIYCKATEGDISVDPHNDF